MPRSHGAGGAGKAAVGALNDDIEGLKSLLEDSSAFSVVDLESLSALLKFLAEEASGM